MFAIVMAGGSGTRFWPASRERMPKQFLKITGDQTMFEETIARTTVLVPEDSIYVVVNKMHLETARNLLGSSKARLLVEPSARNTATCIGLAAVHIARRNDSEPIVVVPSDHFIADLESFNGAVRCAAEVARLGGIVTVGVTPTRPETGYGYIRVGDKAGVAIRQYYYSVEAFVEKPDSETARSLVCGGKHLWNSGVFVFTARTILSEISSQMPKLRTALDAIDEAIDGQDYERVLEASYSVIDPISIDYGVLENSKAPRYVVPGSFGWSDVGSWQALYELWKDKHDAAGNLLLGNVVVQDSQRNLVFSDTDRVVTLLGVRDLAVVDTPEALMVADLDRSQDVKKLRELLEQTVRDEGSLKSECKEN